MACTRRHCYLLAIGFLWVATLASLFGTPCLVNNNSYESREEWTNRPPIGNGTIKHEAPRNLTMQSYAISLHQRSAVEFGKRNAHSGLNGTPWFPGTNSRDQKTLNEWSAVTNFPLLNTSEFPPGDKDKGGYANPHHVGCFLSHWHLLRLALVGWNAVLQDNDKRPDALFVFEDDASCVQHTKQRTLDLIPKLPNDWDLLFIGGKPFSYHEVPIDISRIASGKPPFREIACQGVLGKSSTGPFAPDGSRQLFPEEQPYWKTGYITNSHAYVVNPQRIERILKYIEEPKQHPAPIDIVLANAMRRGDLNAYMPSKEFCVQGRLRREKQQQPNLWEGYYHHNQVGRYEWEEMYFRECPKTYQQGLL
jgi:GR25 family glycosyltransferase involved in LPS biosynthesis